MDIRIDHEKLIRQVRRELDACESFAHNIKTAVREIAGKPFERDPSSLIEQIRYNQQMGRVYLERAVAALELAGAYDEDAGDCADLKTVQQKLRALENAAQLANQAPAVENSAATEIAIKVSRGVVVEVYASDPKTNVTVIDEDENDWLPEEETSQVELPAFKIYG